MKKLIYSLAIILVALSSCTKFDDPKTENYGVGPEVAVSMASAIPTDSAFTIQITPAEGATYYAYAISTSPASVDSATLIKGGYGNTVLKVSNQPSLTINVTTAEPNTTYYVYASACNEKGIVGKVASASIKTSDSGAPKPTATQASATDKAYLVQFNQAILRGDGKVTAVYYKEFDFENPVQVENVDVQISGKIAKLTATDAPAGAYVLFSWEAGAFVDATGNRCAAFTSSVNPEGETISDIFIGLWIRVPTTTWAISDSQFTSPKVGGTFPKWSEFEGVIEFTEKVYVIEDDVKDGDFVVTYTNNSRTVSYKLPKANINFGVAEDFSTQKVTFTLPAATIAGDKVTVSIAEDVFKDVFGNGNAAFASDKVYWIAFSMKKEDVLGTFTYYFYYPAAQKTYNMGNFTVEEYTGEDAEPGDVVIKDLYVPGSVIYGYYNIDECKFYIYNYQTLGILNDPAEGDYGNFIQGTVSGAETIAFDVNADGTLTSSEFRILATDPEYTTGRWWEVPAGETIFAKVLTNAPKRASAKKSKSIRNKSGIPSNLKIFRK